MANYNNLDVIRKSLLKVTSEATPSVVNSSIKIIIRELQKYLDKLENEEKKVEINNIYELKEKGLDINNNKEKGMELGNNTENGNSERRIVRKIKVNKCFNCLCFLCARRKKSLENTLIDEGMGIVMDKLDIINLFRILLIDEKTKEKLKTETFEMSDACKVNIHDMINKIYNSWQK